MKFIVLFLGLLAVGSFASAQGGPPAPKQVATVQVGTAEDEATVRAIVNHWQQTWENFDASILAGDYADDADWLNAFGVRLKGGAKIVEFVSKVVKRPAFKDGIQHGESLLSALCARTWLWLRATTRQLDTRPRMVRRCLRDIPIPHGS
jgi:hypothetical protein